MDYNSIYKEYHLSFNDNWNLYLDEDTYENYTSYPITLIENTFNTYYTQIIKDKKFFIENIRRYDLTEGGTVYIQFNMKRLLLNTQKMFQNKNIKSDIDPIFIIEKIKELENKLKINKHNTNNKLLMMIIRAYLSPKKLIQVYHLNRLAMDYIIGNIYQMYFNSIWCWQQIHLPELGRILRTHLHEFGCYATASFRVRKQYNSYVCQYI